MSYVIETLVFSALSRILGCDNSLDKFFETVKEKLGMEVLSKDYLKLLEKQIHMEEFDNDAGISSDVISIFIYYLLLAFK